MSTLVISLVVVGGAIAVVIWLAVGEAPQPATDESETDRADGDADQPEPDAAESEAEFEAEFEALPVPEREPEPEPEPDDQPEKPLETADAIDGLESVPHEKELDPEPAPPPSSTNGSPASSPPRRRRKPRPVVVDGPVSESVGDRPGGVSLFRRARSGFALIVIVAVVGLGVAAVVGTVAVLISRALEGAVK